MADNKDNDGKQEIRSEAPVGAQFSGMVNSKNQVDAASLQLLDYCAMVLDELKYILVDRGGSYADFRDNSIRMLESLRGGGVISGTTKPDFMVAAEFFIKGKQARLDTGDFRHRDSWLDIANYAILVIACLDREKREAVPSTDFTIR